MAARPIILSESDIRTVLPMGDLIDTMEAALRSFSEGRVVQPVRSVLEIGPDRAFFGVMPAALTDAVGAKLVTVFHRNHERGLPSHLATIVLLDPATGSPIAVLDGRFITEARTAAASAVSVRLLARSDAAVLAIIGSGVQARSHLDAIGRVRVLADVRVWSPTAAHREAFAEAAVSAGQSHVRAVNDVHEAVTGADIIVLATSAREPVIDDRDVAAGAHVCAVGACRPDQREMPTPLVARARVYVDSRDGALVEAGDLLIPIAQGAIGVGHIVGELGELALGRVEGRRSSADVTIFKSLGMAAEDIAAARLAVERARAAELGLPFGFN
jgi:ornithine cyclodeaminase